MLLKALGTILTNLTHWIQHVVTTGKQKKSNHIKRKISQIRSLQLKTVQSRQKSYTDIICKELVCRWPNIVEDFT